MPRRVLNRSFWVSHRGEIGYFIGAIAVILALVGQRQNTAAISHQSQLGAQSHVALCALKTDVASRLAQGEAFLALSKAERIHLYGEALGAVPPATIRASILNQKHTVRALATLRCP
jgi:hypothetical protein